MVETWVPHRLQNNTGCDKTRTGEHPRTKEGGSSVWSMVSSNDEESNERGSNDDSDSGQEGRAHKDSQHKTVRTRARDTTPPLREGGCRTSGGVTGGGGWGGRKAVKQATDARGPGHLGKEAGTPHGEPSVLSFKGATGGDERWILLIRACMQTAVIAPGGQETVNMWCDGRGRSKGGSRKDVAKKIADDLNRCEPAFENRLSADTVVAQFQGALKQVQSLRYGTTPNMPKEKAQLLWELESADKRLAPKCSKEKRTKDTCSLRRVAHNPSRRRRSRSPNDTDAEEHARWQREQEDKDEEEDEGEGGECRRRKRKSNGAFKRMEDEMQVSRNVVKDLTEMMRQSQGPQAQASTFAYSNSDVEEVTREIEKVLQDANQKHGAEVQEELDSLETVLHKSINIQPTLIGRVKMWLMRSPQEDPGTILMRVAFKCQTLTAPADTTPTPANKQWPKLCKSCG